MGIDDEMTTEEKRRAVFLDRDGVLIATSVRDGVPHPASCLGEVQILPGVHDALCRLAELGLPRIVVTNQPDVSRGAQTREAVDEIHAYLAQHLDLTEIYTCWHDDGDGCACRKPKPGLLLDAAQKYALDLPRCFLVGDRWRDISAGEAAGCTTFLINEAYSQAEKCRADYRVPNLPVAVERIIHLLRRMEFIPSRGRTEFIPSPPATRQLNKSPIPGEP